MTAPANKHTAARPHIFPVPHGINPAQTQIHHVLSCAYRSRSKVKQIKCKRYLFSCVCARSHIVYATQIIYNENITEYTHANTHTQPLINAGIVIKVIHFNNHVRQPPVLERASTFVDAPPPCDTLFAHNIKYSQSTAPAPHRLPAPPARPPPKTVNTSTSPHITNRTEPQRYDNQPTLWITHTRARGPERRSSSR